MRPGPAAAVAPRGFGRQIPWDAPTRCRARTKRVRWTTSWEACCDVTSRRHAGLMKVMVVAELCGVTVRTVRHYHAKGLLPLPPVVGGVRDYGLAEVARVTRIRWLADSGLSLTQISAVLAADREPVDPDDAARQVVTDLGSALRTLDERLADLRGQRDRLAMLLTCAADGGPLSPLPALVAAFYAELEAGAGDDETRRGVREEREFLELAYFRGQLPPEAEALFLGATPESIQEGLDAFAVSQTMAELSDDDIESLATANLARMRSRLGDRYPQVAASIDLDALTRLYALYDKVADERGRRLGRAMRRQLTLEIEAWRSP